MANSLKRIGMYSTPTEAALFMSVLEANGIHAMLRNDNMATLGYPGLKPIGVELIVHEEDYDRACTILEQDIESDSEEDENIKDDDTDMSYE